MERIERFDGQYAFLSNFHMTAPLHMNGLCFPSSEHAYQAQKVLPELRHMFTDPFMSPGKAKRIGNKLKVVRNWDSVKLAIMAEILITKFEEPALHDLLLATGDAELVEGNTWNDRYWGVCDGIGENNLGKLLMRIRLFKAMT